MLGVINDVPDMSKIEAGKFELAPTEFSFEKMLRRAVSIINFRVGKKHQIFSVNIDTKIPPELIGDEQRLTQVIINLLSNAVKFTPENGSMRLNAKLEKIENDDCVVRVEVTDSGIGISEGQQSRLFHSFAQAETGTSRKFGGTGLGLAISKHIVEMMNGEIWIESELGKGASFIFTIKVEIGADAQTGLLNPGVNWRNIRVPAVDDAPEIREYFAIVAEQLHFSCDVADNGVSAMQMIKQKSAYDLYFVDWKMPGMSGIEPAQHIKEKKRKSPWSL